MRNTSFKFWCPFVLRRDWCTRLFLTFRIGLVFFFLCCSVEAWRQLRLASAMRPTQHWWTCWQNGLVRMHGLAMNSFIYFFKSSTTLSPNMASNAMSRIENQDGTCLVQILLSHTFLPWSFCTEKHKITLLAFFSKTNGVWKPLQSDSALLLAKIAHFDVDFTVVLTCCPHLRGVFSSAEYFPDILPIETYTKETKVGKLWRSFLQNAGWPSEYFCSPTLVASFYTKVNMIFSRPDFHFLVWWLGR